MKLVQQVQSLFFIGVLTAACGCGANKSVSNKGDAAADGLISGGSGERGGAAGSTGAGGTSGTGGSTKTGGATGTGGTTRTGGATKTGGATGGGTGMGGQGSGGRTVSGGGASGGAAKLDAGAPDAARAEVGSDSKAPDTAPDAEHRGADALADAPMDAFSADTSSGLSLDSCFAGLPAQVGAQMIATKSSSDGRVRMRIALDTEDRMGTAGSLGWGVIRLAVEVDGVVTCITDRASLTYTNSHHNCSDRATATEGTTTYLLTAPDDATTTLTILVNGTRTGTTTLTNSACTMMWTAGSPITCHSGGPC